MSLLEEFPNNYIEVGDVLTFKSGDVFISGPVEKIKFSRDLVTVGGREYFVDKVTKREKPDVPPRSFVCGLYSDNVSAIPFVGVVTDSGTIMGRSVPRDDVHVSRSNLLRVKVISVSELLGIVPR